MMEPAHRHDIRFHRRDGNRADDASGSVDNHASHTNASTNATIHDVRCVGNPDAHGFIWETIIF